MVVKQRQARDTAVKAEFETIAPRYRERFAVFMKRGGYEGLAPLWPTPFCLTRRSPTMCGPCSSASSGTQRTPPKRSSAHSRVWPRWWGNAGGHLSGVSPTAFAVFRSATGDGTRPSLETGPAFIGAVDCSDGTPIMELPTVGNRAIATLLMLRPAPMRLQWADIAPRATGRTQWEESPCQTVQRPALGSMSVPLSDRSGFLNPAQYGNSATREP